MIAYLLWIVVMILSAPLFLTLIKLIKMWLLFKKPISILQGYRNFSKLLTKEVLVSQEASAITHIAPYMVLAPLLVVLFLLPPPSNKTFFIGFTDAFTITGLIALSSFFLMLLGLDSASSFAELEAHVKPSSAPLWSLL